MEKKNVRLKTDGKNIEKRQNGKRNVRKKTNGRWEDNCGYQTCSWRDPVHPEIHVTTCHPSCTWVWFSPTCSPQTWCCSQPVHNNTTKQTTWKHNTAVFTPNTTAPSTEQHLNQQLTDNLKIECCDSEKEERTCFFFSLSFCFYILHLPFHKVSFFL